MEHMRETALGSLKALGLDGHQVLIAAHGDKEHLHVHHANQIAHALNSNLPAHVSLAWQTVNELLHALMRDEMLSQRTSALRTRTPANDPPPPQTRDVFQRSCSATASGWGTGGRLPSARSST